MNKNNIYLLCEYDFDDKYILGYSSDKNVLLNKKAELLKPFQDEQKYVEENRERLQRELDEYMNGISGTGSPPSLDIEFPNYCIEEVEAIE